MGEREEERNTQELRATERKQRESYKSQKMATIDQSQTGWLWENSSTIPHVHCKMLHIQMCVKRFGGAKGR